MKKDTEKNNLIPEDDYEYEKNLAQQRRESEKEREEKYLARIEEEKNLQKQEQKEREKRIAQDRVELMKLKSGVIDTSDSITEEHDVIREVHGLEKISNFWYHYKIIIIFVLFISVVVGFITYDTVTRKKPDITVMMIADNGLSMRQTEMQTFFEKYTDDLNGDGEVHVSVITMPLTADLSGGTNQLSYQSKFLAQLQSSESIMVITDSNTDPDYLEIMKSDLAKDFPDNDYIDEYGLSLNMKIVADEFKYEYLPNDVHLAMRIPVKTVNDTLDEMEENYDQSFVVFSRIVEDLTKRAQETSDPGLSTEPLKVDTSEAKDDNSSKTQSETASK